MLKAYIDESYGDHVFTLGGWLAQAEELDRLGSQWEKRIYFENRRLERQGRRILPLSRFRLQ